MPSPYSGPIGYVASSPTSPFKIRSNATGARSPEVNVFGFGVADEREPEVGPAPPDYSATPVPAEQPEFDSAEALPIVPPLPIDGFTPAFRDMSTLLMNRAMQANPMPCGSIRCGIVYVQEVWPHRITVQDEHPLWPTESEEKALQ